MLLVLWKKCLIMKELGRGLMPAWSRTRSQYNIRWFGNTRAPESRNWGGSIAATERRAAVWAAGYCSGVSCKLPIALDEP